jgi:hypothetical protein
VKRVIRNRAGLYLKADGTWTKDLEQAVCFSGFKAVISEKERLSLKEVDLVLLIKSTPSPKYDVVLPLRDTLS